MGNDNHPCSLSVSQGHMCAPDSQAAIQQADPTISNPFSFSCVQGKRELDLKVVLSSPCFCCCSRVVAWQRNKGDGQVGGTMYPVQVYLLCSGFLSHARPREEEQVATCVFGRSEGSSGQNLEQFKTSLKMKSA